MKTSQEDILAEIYEAFAGVSRMGGVSWSESKVIDNYGSDKDRHEARWRDGDRFWEELVDDPHWEPERLGDGGFAFLDAIGARYYLPAVMVRSVKTLDDVAMIWSRLTKREEETWDEWVLLDHRQELCVRHFLEYMIEALLAAHPTEEWEQPWFEVADYQKALESHWISIDEIPLRELKKGKKKGKRRR